MKKNILFIILFASFSAVISSCKKKDSTGLLIPDDAAMVVHFNAASLSSKLSWDNIKATNWFQKFQNENHDSLAQQFLADPASNGIDLKSDLVYFLKMRSTGAYIVVNGKLKNDSAFAAHCKKLIPDGTQSRDGSFSFITKDDNSAVIWNKERFAFVANTPNMMWNRRYDNESPAQDQKTVTADSLKNYGEKIINLSNTQTLGTDSRFASLINQPGDIHAWIDIGKIYSSTNMTGQMMSMMKVSSLFEGNIYAMTLNFDNGKISLNGKNYQGEEMSKIWKKYPPKRMDETLINRLPANDVMVAFVNNFKPEAIKDIFKTIGVDGLINLFLGKSNLSLDDIINANKGQMLFALTGIDTKNAAKISGKLNTEEDKEPMNNIPRNNLVKFIFANAINNKGDFDRLLDLLKGKEGMFENDLKDYTFRVKDDWFAAGDSANVAAFFSGHSNTVPYADRISGHPFGAYIDFQKIISHLAGKNTDSSRAAALTTSKNMWQDMVMTGGDFTDGALNFSLDVNLVNKQPETIEFLSGSDGCYL